MFYDEATITVRSGDGGDGMVSFRREKFVPFGGPDGGDGGDGGDVIFVANSHISGLGYFRRNTQFRAEHGVGGGTANKTGARGAALHLQVPVGTLIRDAETGDLLADMVANGQEAIIAAGGAGGRGNARFASSTNRAPRVAERGEPGEEMSLQLELKLIADIGLVGKPNAGKSTLLSMISAARPKVANYPFTTLVPNLGVVEIDEYDTFVVADLPGLIEGAAEGHGLGHAFLRHVERTRVLIHLLDGAAESPHEDWRQINAELERYGAGLSRKPQLVVLNKIDLPDAIAWQPILAEMVEAAGYTFMVISAATGDGVKAMLRQAHEMLLAAPAMGDDEPTEEPVIRPQKDDRSFEIERLDDHSWRIHGAWIERLAQRTFFGYAATALRFQRQLDRSGISAALRDAGVSDGDDVYIGDIALEWQEE